jgi:hypothetical protein
MNSRIPALQPFQPSAVSSLVEAEQAVAQLQVAVKFFQATPQPEKKEELCDEINEKIENLEGFFKYAENHLTEEASNEMRLLFNASVSQFRHLGNLIQN